MQKIKRHDNEHQTNSGANFKQLCLERTAAHAGNIRLKEILKRRALFGNQTFVHLINSCGMLPVRASKLPLL